MDNMQKKLLDDQIEAAFKQSVVELANEATKIISSRNHWIDNPAYTDIVDLGQLRASQQIVFDITGGELRAEIRYPVEYAAAVHNGATIVYANGNTRRIGARPWMKRAAQRRPIDKSMARNLR